MTDLSAPSRSHRPYLGILFMCLACTLFPIMNGLVKFLSAGYQPEQIVWARTTSHLLFIVLLFGPRMGASIFRTNQLGSQIWRSCLLLGSTFLFFSAIAFVPIANAASVSFTAPLVVVLLAWPMLGERITLPRVAAVLVGFGGVLIVIRPGSEVFHWASLMILGSATFYAVYQVLTRKVAGKDHPETSALYSALVGTLVMSAIVPFAWKTPDNMRDVVLLVSLGVLGGLGHYCVAKAMTYAAANFVSPFNYWQMVGSVAVGYLMFAEIPDFYTWVGAALIIGAGLYVGWQTNREQRRAAKAAIA
ncbi:MAG: DMT family transporter [Alphaproteobacteria bacterium]|nr:DMT family transporter [Alphaproteobacteria bacterium]